MTGTLTLHTSVNDEEQISSENDKKPTVLSFNNRYDATGSLDGTTKLAGQKEIAGPWPSDDYSGFEFAIAGGDETTNDAIKNGDVVL